MRILLTCLLLMSIGACTNSVQQKDSAPLGRLDPDSIKDAIPRDELITRAGNTSPYTVLGKTYTLMEKGDKYIERGNASWYGTKFHGRPTANGETYSLYGMTAAHRTLPIPTYVKVTNLSNMRTAIVRVNDRGPFHSERIIDLSYAAAVKLGYAEQGTTLVQVEVIDTRNSVSQPIDSLPAKDYYLQVAAFSERTRADLLVDKLKDVIAQPVAVKDAGDTFHRVWIGPIADLNTVRTITDLLELHQLGSPKLVQP